MRDGNATFLITWNMCPISLNLSSGQLVYQKSKYLGKPNELWLSLAHDCTPKHQMYSHLGVDT